MRSSLDPKRRSLAAAARITPRDLERIRSSLARDLVVMLEKPSISIISIACACTFSLFMAACVTEANYPERAADLACSKLQECSPEAYTEGCEESYEELIAATIDECDTYRGGLAHRCLNAVEAQACDEVSTPSACEKFNEKCGFAEPQPVEGLDLESYGLGQLRAVQ